MHSAKLTFLLFLILALIICNPSKAEWITKKSDKKDVEEKASGGLIRGFPKLATKGFRK